MRWGIVLLVIIVVAFWLGGKVDRTPKPINYPPRSQAEVTILIDQWISEHEGAYLVGYEQDASGIMVKVVIVTNHVEMYYFIFDVNGDVWTLDHMFCTNC